MSLRDRLDALVVDDRQEHCPAHQGISSSSPNQTEGARCELLMLAMAPDCESAPKAGPQDILAEPLSIMGHSMGGHGALTIGLSLTDRYKAISAFAPIVAPAQVPWGEKAFLGYRGENRRAWRKHDAVALIEDGARVAALLIDQGGADQFLDDQLRPELLEAACSTAGIPLTINVRPSYDHSYYFIAV